MKKLLAIVAVSILLGACSAPKRIVDYKTDTVWKTKTEFVNQVLRDSVIVHDSVIVKAVGDTVYEYRYRDRWRTSYAHDTLHKTDTVYVAKDQSEQIALKASQAPTERKHRGLRVALCLLLIAFVLYKSKKNYERDNK